MKLNEVKWWIFLETKKIYTGKVYIPPNPRRFFFGIYQLCMMDLLTKEVLIF